MQKKGDTSAILEKILWLVILLLLFGVAAYFILKKFGGMVNF
jgi:hypothetical protein